MMNDERPEILNDPIATLRRRWKVAALSAAISIAVAGSAIAIFVGPSYEATARVFVSSPRISADFVPVVESGDPFERINAMIGTILARPSLSDLVDTHNLFPDSRQPREAILNQVRDAIAFDIDAEFQPVIHGGDTARVFQIQFAYGEPKLAAEVANALSARFVEENIRVRTEHARITANFMKQELVQADKALVEQNRLITQLKQNARGELPDELDSSLNRLERLQARSDSLALQIAKTESNLVVLSQQVIGSGAAVGPEERLELLRSEIDEAASRFTANHPHLINLRIQAKELERTIAQREGEERRRPSLIEGTRRTLAELHTQLRDAKADIALLEARVARTPERAEQLAELERKAAVLRENYVEFERKAQDADLALRVELAQQGRQVVVLEHAEPPTSPAHSPLLYLLLVLGLGVAVGLGVVALLENADPVMASDEHLKIHVGVPILASIPPLESGVR